MKVLIILGSDSDLESAKKTVEILKHFDVSYKVRIASAHRTPSFVEEIVSRAAGDGYAVIIAQAGLAAHLAGVCAAHTILPVIAVPLDRGSLGGRDALYASVMMPAGVPVATVAIGDFGAKNAAFLAIRILALSDALLQKKILEHRDSMAQAIIDKDKKISASI